MEGGILIRQDVSARVRMQQEFLQSEERLALALDAVEDGLWDWNLVTNEAYFSPRYYTMLGYQPGEFPASYDTWKRLLHPEDLAPTQHRIESAIAAGQGFRVEFRCRTKDGQWKWIEGRGRVVEFDDGRPVRAVGTHTDITERMQVRRALLEARDAAEAANRVKSEFLANMSHELRTPLNGIMGVLQLLRLENLPPQQAEQVAVALDSARNLLRVLTDILELSRAAAGFAAQRAPVDVVDVANHALALVRTQAQRSGVELRLEAEEHLWVESDAARLRQILMNLVGNAAKFTPHGEVVVRVDALTSADGRQRLLLQVEDTGIGMIAAHLPRAFERFRQEDASLTRKYQGAGLGLAVVKRLVEFMGGTITVDTAPGEGFWIAVCVPARRVAPPAEETMSSSHEGLPQYGLKVLVVEDDDVNRFMARALLQKLGCHVEEAVNGLEALARLRADNYDVAFLDIQMPEMDGLQTARAIRSYPEFAGMAAMPLVALTAHALPEDEARARDAGMGYFLTKPLDIHQLMAVLDRIVTALAV
jgi:PAS domain S-box-containing protein